MTDVLDSVIRGLSFGSVFALLAVSLVLTYRTTGVFNLAFGPQAFLAAAIYYDTHVAHGWPLVVSLVFSVGIVSPLVGVVLDRGLFRYLRSASETAKLVSVLGLFVALPQMIFLWFGLNNKSNGVGIVPDGSVTYSPLHNIYVSRDDLAIIVVGVVVFVGLTLILRYSAIGLRMRAVVESPRLAELAGVNADRSSMISWMLSSGLAGLAGVLLTPVFAGQVGYPAYETLAIAAIAAAVIGGLSNIPLAYAGGLALGILQQLLDRYLPTNSILASGLRPALPFVVLFLVLIFSPAVLLRRGRVRPTLRRRSAAAGARVGRPERRSDPRMTRSSAVAVLLGPGLLPVLPRQQLVGRPGRACRDPVDHLLVDHRHHRFRRPDLVVPSDVRRDRRVRDRAARDPARHVGTGCGRHRCRDRRGGGRAGRAAGAAARRHLPVARDAGLRVLLRPRAVAAQLGGRRPPADRRAAAARRIDRLQERQSAS